MRYAQGYALCSDTALREEPPPTHTHTSSSSHVIETGLSKKNKRAVEHNGQFLLRPTSKKIENGLYTNIIYKRLLSKAHVCRLSARTELQV
jgi:hypothetical protein